MSNDLSAHGKGFPGFYLRGSAEWESGEGFRHYRHHLERAGQELDLTAVFCVDGKPTAYFTKVEGPDAKREAQWQRLLWNQDTASMLVVVDPANTRIYSALSTPTENPPAAGDARLAQELETAALALEFRQFLLSVQTGQFYRDRPEKFRPEAAVDHYLLTNLTHAREELTADKYEDRLSPELANAFLARCLFTTYLIERKVIGKDQLEQIEAPVAPTLRLVLEGRTDSDAIRLLFRLFRLLNDDFNGSMFGGAFPAEQTEIRARHVKVLRRLLHGDDLKAEQPVFFDLYDFHFIPIELISAIYENFVGANTDQSERGAYYTPPRLAELVVDIATEGWETLLGKRYLDPSCGSGVFMVILFQRMASEWSKRHPRATNVERALALRKMLTNDLCGIDLDPNACMVACFSLYLAFLDQLKPRDIWQLKEALEKAGTEKVLPPLHEKPTVNQARCPVVLETNFFSRGADSIGQFDLVIGNPPWTGRNQAVDPEIERWLLAENPVRNPFLKDAPARKPARKATFFPQNQSAIGYMWKVPQHLKTTGYACLLLPTRVILSNKSDAFQAEWFRRITVDQVWQLADYSFILFRDADCPAIVAKFRSATPDTDKAEIAYYTPKVEQIDPRHASILVTPDDRKTLRVIDLLAAAKDDCAYMFWKMPFWGTDRDRRLLDRLRRLPKLELLAGEPEEGKRWTKGKGLQPLSDADERKLGEESSITRKRSNEKKPWWSSDAAFLPASGSWGLVLVRDDTMPFGEVPERLRRLPDQKVFSHPLVVVNDGFSRIAFADFDVLFQHSLGAISAPNQDEDELLFLAALLNSPIATYFLFHTSANWGVERDKVHFEELLQLPCPLPEQTENPAASRAIIRKVATRLRKARKEMAVEGALAPAHREAARQRAIRDTTELVYEFYGLTSWERALVEDTVSIFEPSSTPPSLNTDIETLKTSQPEVRKTYADLLCGTINRWARRSKYRLSPSAAIADKEGLVLLTLTKAQPDKASAPYHEKPATQQMSKLIERVAEASIDAVTGSLKYLRGFALFEEQQVHILKPIARRYWTRTAALNDADELAGFIANMGQEA